MRSRFFLIWFLSVLVFLSAGCGGKPGRAPDETTGAIPEAKPDGQPTETDFVENLLITPHISGGFHLRETFNRIVSIAAENLHALDTEGTLRNIVDFTTGYRKR